VTTVVRAQLSVLIVHLCVIRHKCLTVTNFIVLVSIWSSHDDGSMVEGIEGALERERRLGSTQADINGSQNSDFVPLPEDEQPIRFSRKSN
jgi:hypothetical protein